MAYILPYRLFNKIPDDQTIYATAVFVENTQSESLILKKPSKGTEKGNNPDAATFEYLPWQILNPSSGAIESFTFTDELFLVASFPPCKENPEPVVSAKTRVYFGQNIVLTRQGDEVAIAREKTTQSGPIAVRNHTKTGPGAIAQLEWYLGDCPRPIGRISNLAPKVTTRFQLGAKLYFCPFPAIEGPRESYSSATVMNFPSYTPPPSASADVGVRIYFALPDKTDISADIQNRDYVFCPPSMDWRPAKAGDPPPCRRFERPHSGSKT